MRDKTERWSQSAGGEASADGVGNHAITSITKVIVVSGAKEISVKTILSPY